MVGFTIFALTLTSAFGFCNDNPLGGRCPNFTFYSQQNKAKEEF